MLLEDQKLPVYTVPYALAWTGCAERDGVCHHGIGVWHTDSDSVVFGGGNPAEYFYNPSHLQHVVLSAAGLNSSTRLFAKNAAASSITVLLSPSAEQTPLMELPLVQGMGFVTAVYHNATPIVSSLVGFQDFTHAGRKSRDGTNKYIATLTDGATWVLYVIPTTPSDRFQFVSNDQNKYIVNGTFSGMIQLAKLSTESKSSEVYDKTYGANANDTTISGSAMDSKGQYTIAWTKAGAQDKELLMFALPHHVESLSLESRGRIAPLSLRTPTKGTATAVIGSNITLQEPDLPRAIGFLPWSPDRKIDQVCVQNSTLYNLLTELARSEIEFDIVGRLAEEQSIYWSGKTIASYARVVHSMAVIQERALAEIGLAKLKSILSTWVGNSQKHRLLYENVWGGVVTSWAYDAQDVGVDYGNAIYNDHHFHYGYFVYAASVVAALDPTWVSDGNNKVWINTLVRDFANPVDDAYFPFSRSFDWYHGHSWATGVDPIVDGKNEESSSEDVFALYAVKLWGYTIGDVAMEARADLELAILRRSLRNYFLMESSNKNHPSRFIDNKVVGILFENKLHHTTFFGANMEFIHGIHMLPISPISAYARSKEFVTEEWQTFFSGNFTPQDKAWTSVLKANQALIDPLASFEFFSSNASGNRLMSGESRAYYLFYSSILAGLW